MKQTEINWYEKVIAGLENELKIANKNVEDLTHTIDEYEVELQAWQNKFEDERMNNKRLEFVLMDTLKRNRTLKKKLMESEKNENI